MNKIQACHSYGNLYNFAMYRSFFTEDQIREKSVRLWNSFKEHKATLEDRAYDSKGNQKKYHRQYR